MELVIGKPHGNLTRLESEERHATLALDKTDRVTLLLGANVVEVTYGPDGWSIRNSRNVTNVPGSANELFVEAGTETTAVHNKVHG